MRLNRKDTFFIGAVALVLALLALGTLKGQGQAVPFDDLHRPSYLSLKNGRSQAELELACTTCHSKSSLAFSKVHPPKEQCLICHKLLTE